MQTCLKNQISSKLRDKHNSTKNMTTTQKKFIDILRYQLQDFVQLF